MNFEVELDKFLKIKTNGRDDSNSNFINFPYEPTPYLVLQAISNSGYITKKDKIIDYGSGKGRVDFFFAYSNKTKMIGVEYDERLYNSAIENKKRFSHSKFVEFVNSCASQFDFPVDATGAYFFNPFSIEILKQVIDKIYISKNINNREVKLFFYYPSIEYLDYLKKINAEHIDDIDCRDQFEGDNREYVTIYKI